MAGWTGLEPATSDVTDRGEAPETFASVVEPIREDGGRVLLASELTPQHGADLGQARIAPRLRHQAALLEVRSAADGCVLGQLLGALPRARAQATVLLLLQPVGDALEQVGFVVALGRLAKHLAVPPLQLGGGELPQRLDLRGGCVLLLHVASFPARGRVGDMDALKRSGSKSEDRPLGREDL